MQNSHYITTIAKYKILFDDRTKTIVRINSPKVTNFEIKSTNYPGWNVRIDGKPINVSKESVYISFNVPEGDHVIEISYKPISFIVGLLMSLLFVLVMAIYYLRCELKSKKILSFKKKYDNAFSKFSSKDFSNILLLACLLAFALTFSSNLFINSYLPSSKFISFTTSINWLTTNHHSLTLDYIRIALFGISLFFSFLISFIIVLWKKNQ